VRDVELQEMMYSEISILMNTRIRFLQDIVLAAPSNWLYIFPWHNSP